ncbi:MAG: DapH/DapD/GlmU-related protein [Bauldia sp.]
MLIGKPFEGLIRSPITVDYGIHITLGKAFVNSHCVFLDSNTITIGDGGAIGTGVQLLAAGHPIHPSDRIIPWDPKDDPPFRGIGLAKPIVIGDEVWIGGGAIVLGGVTIGRGSTIGAGSVVTRSIRRSVWPQAIRRACCARWSAGRRSFTRTPTIPEPSRGRPERRRVPAGRAEYPSCPKL